MNKQEYIVKYGSIYKRDLSNMIDNLAIVVNTKDGKVLHFGDRERDGEWLRNQLETRVRNLEFIGYTEEIDYLKYIEIDTIREQFGLTKGLKIEDSCSILNYCINCSGQGVRDLIQSILNNDIDRVLDLVTKIQQAGY